MPADALSDPSTLTTHTPPSGSNLSSTLSLLLVFFLVAAGAIGGGTLYFRSESAEVYADASRQLELISELKQRQLTQWRLDRLGDAEVLKQRNQRSRPVQAVVTTNDAPSRQDVEGWLSAYTDAYNEYDRVFVLDSEGKRRLSVPSDAAAPADFLVRAAQAAMADGQARLTDFYLDDTDRVPHLALVSPIPAPSGGSAPGAMVLRIDARKFLYPMLAVEQQDSDTGETQLVRREGDDVLFLNPLRFAPDSALSLHASAADKARLATMAGDRKSTRLNSSH